MGAADKCLVTRQGLPWHLQASKSSPSGASPQPPLAAGRCARVGGPTATLRPASTHIPWAGVFAAVPITGAVLKPISSAGRSHITLPYVILRRRIGGLLRDAAGEPPMRCKYRGRQDARAQRPGNSQPRMVLRGMPDQKGSHLAGQVEMYETRNR